jgi:hypothetical protein
MCNVPELPANNPPPQTPLSQSNYFSYNNHRPYNLLCQHVRHESVTRKSVVLYDLENLHLQFMVQASGSKPAARE